MRLARQLCFYFLCYTYFHPSQTKSTISIDGQDRISPLFQRCWFLTDLQISGTHIGSDLAWAWQSLSVPFCMEIWGAWVNGTLVPAIGGGWLEGSWIFPIILTRASGIRGLVYRIPYFITLVFILLSWRKWRRRCWNGKRKHECYISMKKGGLWRYVRVCVGSLYKK